MTIGVGRLCARKSESNPDVHGTSLIEPLQTIQLVAQAFSLKQFHSKKTPGLRLHAIVVDSDNIRMRE